MFKEELKQKFLEFGLKESSSKSYSNIIFTIIKKLNVNPVKLKEKVESWFIVEDFNESFKNLKKTTIRNYISSVIALMKVNNEVDSDLYKKLSIDVEEFNSFYQRMSTSGNLSEIEKKLWVDSNVLENMYNQHIKPMIAGYPLYAFSKKQKKITFIDVQPQTLKQTYEYVIVSIYLYPFVDPNKTIGVLRNDVGTLHFYKQGRKKDISKFLELDKNYYVQGQYESRFILNVYKTDKTHGQAIIILPEELHIILKAWSIFMQLKDSEIVFESISKTDITSILQKYTKKYTGKNLGSQMLRKIFLTSTFKDEKEDSLRLANSMGHSTSIQQDIYVKNI